MNRLNRPEPNIQNIPIHTPDGAKTRKAFVNTECELCGKLSGVCGKLGAAGGLCRPGSRPASIAFINHEWGQKWEEINERADFAAIELRLLEQLHGRDRQRSA